MSDRRDHLSKSALSVFDICPTKAWHELNHRVPPIETPRMAQGTVIHAGVEHRIVAAGAGIPAEAVTPIRASYEAAKGVGPVPLLRVARYLQAFERDVIPAMDWRGVQVESFLRVRLSEHWPEIVAYPDLILPDPLQVFDLKSGKEKKSARTLELGLYALCVEEAKGRPVERVGYIVCRTDLVPPPDQKKPKKGASYADFHPWQVISTPVDDALRNYTRARVNAYVAAQRADDYLNNLAPGADRMNFAFGAVGQAWACEDCQYAPKFGGPCQVAATEEPASVA